MPGEVRRLAQMLIDTPEVVEADRVTGEDCFLAKVHEVHFGCCPAMKPKLRLDLNCVGGSVSKINITEANRAFQLPGMVANQKDAGGMRFDPSGGVIATEPRARCQERANCCLRIGGRLHLGLRVDGQRHQTRHDEGDRKSA